MIRTALGWTLIALFVVIAWLLDNPPWLGTIAMLGMAIALASAFMKLEDQIADLRAELRYENEEIKERLAAKDEIIVGLAARIRDLESG